MRLTVNLRPAVSEYHIKASFVQLIVIAMRCEASPTNRVMSSKLQMTSPSLIEEPLSEWDNQLNQKTAISIARRLINRNVLR